MNTKIGRNDPCPCGSGKKYKSCCLSKETTKRAPGKKLTAKWLNAPHVPNLIERTFGNAIASKGKEYQAPSEPTEENKPKE